MQCGICKTAVSKYKCPLCRLPYCSLPCFKDHKAGSPCVTVKPQESLKEEGQVDGQPPRDFDNGDDEQQAVRLRRQQLEAVAASPEIRAMLKDQELQDIVRRIDASAAANRDLDVAMNHPPFKDLVDKILDVIARHR